MYQCGKYYLGLAFKTDMSSGSTTSRKSREFVGAYVDPATKRKVERRAESEGKTISDVVRRRLRRKGEEKDD